MRFVICLLAFIALPVAAQDTGWYVGGGAGTYSIDFDDISGSEIGADPSGNLDFDIEGTAVGAYGGWQFNQYVAVELGYRRLMEDDDSDSIDDGSGTGTPSPSVLIDVEVETEVDVWALTVNPTLPIGENFALFGKAGWAWYWIDATIKIPPVLIGDPAIKESDDDNDNDFTYGVGGEWKAERWGVRAEVDAIDVSDADVWSWLLSVKYRF